MRADEVGHGDVTPDELSNADRRELRLLYTELGMLARAPLGPRRPVFPLLPGTGETS